MKYHDIDHNYVFNNLLFFFKVLDQIDDDLKENAGVEYNIQPTLKRVNNTWKAKIRIYKKG